MVEHLKQYKEQLKLFLKEKKIEAFVDNISERRFEFVKERPENEFCRNNKLRKFEVEMSNSTIERIQKEISLIDLILNSTLEERVRRELKRLNKTSTIGKLVLKKNPQ